MQIKKDGYKYRKTMVYVEGIKRKLRTKPPFKLIEACYKAAGQKQEIMIRRRR